MSDTEDKKSSGPSYEERIKHVSIIAQPLASKKHTKRVYKVVKKATKVKGIKRGVKEVVKGIRKGEKGLCIIAGDISPIDVISHIPVLCEENDIPYIFTPSKVCMQPPWLFLCSRVVLMIPLCYFLRSTSARRPSPSVLLVAY